jgi:3-oxosteroid 1-dehydrogenase
MANEFDFVVVGTGVAGLVGAIAAHDAGLRPIVIEKANKWGGTTSLSGGVLWVLFPVSTYGTDLRL